MRVDGSDQRRLTTGAGESGNDDDRGADSRSVSRDSTVPIGFSSKFVIAKSLCHVSALI